MTPQPTSQSTSPSDPQPLTVWQHKPWWCQPWSIALTGTAIISGSWVLFHIPWVTLLVCVPILTWMGFFLVIYPRLFAQAMSAETQRPL